MSNKYPVETQVAVPVATEFVLAVDLEAVDAGRQGFGQGFGQGKFPYVRGSGRSAGGVWLTLQFSMQALREGISAYPLGHGLPLAAVQGHPDRVPGTAIEKLYHHFRVFREPIAVDALCVSWAGGRIQHDPKVTIGICAVGEMSNTTTRSDA